MCLRHHLPLVPASYPSLVDLLDDVGIELLVPAAEER